MDTVSSQLPNAKREQEAILRLAPYVVGRARRGVVGRSPYARSLRAAIAAASSNPDRQTVLISGEPGLEKDNIAALVHFGSRGRRSLLIRIDASLLPADGGELFQASIWGPALLSCLGKGTLLIDRLDAARPELRPLLVALAVNGNWPGGTAAIGARVIFTAESPVPELDGLVQRIRVPPLRVRRQDLGDWIRYDVRQISRKLGWTRPPEVPEVVVKRLQGHDFANNLRELDVIVERALQQASSQEAIGEPAVLPEDVFWTSSLPSLHRFEIWRWKPQLRNLMRAPWLWNGLLFGLMSWLFVAVNLALWLGPQERIHNGVLNLFWAWWWPLILLGFPLVGRLWCSFCPFMVWGEIGQRLATTLGWKPRPWPRGNTDRWASPTLAAGFAGILLWEELGNLENTAWLSSCLLLAITAGAVVGSLLFEKRFWCRYLCPVGGMNGLMAKLSVLELRAEAGTCSGSCSSFACFKGGPAEGEGLSSAGCPLGTHPAHLNDNRNCVLCLTCAQACPHRSVQLRLRPPAADLQRRMTAPDGEKLLLLVLFGGVMLHHWEPWLGWLQWAPQSLQEGPLLPRMGIGMIALGAPLLVASWWSKPWLYGLLPLVWALLLARHLPMGMGEAGRLLQVSLWPWLGEQAGNLPSWSADPHVIAYCQSAVLLLGTLWSLVILRRLLGRQQEQVLASGLALSTAILGRWLIAA